jgi:hypothetical protein
MQLQGPGTRDEALLRCERRPPPAALHPPAPPLNSPFWANASPPGCRRSRSRRPRRLPTLLSNSLPQCGFSAPNPHLSSPRIVNLGCLAPVLSYILTIPRAGFPFTLASSLIRNSALFLLSFFYYGAGSFPRWLRGRFYLRTLFCPLRNSFCDHTSGRRRTTLSTSYIPLTSRLFIHSTPICTFPVLLCHVCVTCSPTEGQSIDARRYSELCAGLWTSRSGANTCVISVYIRETPRSISKENEAKMEFNAQQ